MSEYKNHNEFCPHPDDATFVIESGQLWHSLVLLREHLEKTVNELISNKRYQSASRKLDEIIKLQKLIDKCATDNGSGFYDYTCKPTFTEGKRDG